MPELKDPQENSYSNSFNELQYEELKDYTLYNGCKMGLLKADCEDILHDTLLRILEEDIPKPLWKQKIFSALGNHVTKLKRDNRKRTKY